MRSHCRPNTNSMRAHDEAQRVDREVASAGPSAATMTASAPSAAATPQPADRQPRVTPTASTIVSASTISTAHARNAASEQQDLCMDVSAYCGCGVR